VIVVYPAAPATSSFSTKQPTHISLKEEGKWNFPIHVLVKKGWQMKAMQTQVRITFSGDLRASHQ
jgi:hypothetical protein